MDKKNGSLDVKERDKLLFWFAQAGMWGRFSGSTETVIDQDLAALEGPNGGLDALIEQLRLWHGGLRVESGHFTGLNRPGFTGGQNSRRIAHYGTDTQQEDLEALFT
jgi:hypothetical protein